MTTSMFPALMILFIAINSVPSECSTSCCPSCSVESIPPMSDTQLGQIMSKKDVITAIEQDPHLLYNSSYQTSFVSLTKQQSAQILRNFPDLFRDRESYQNTSTTVGTVSESPTTGGRTRRSTSSQVCPPHFGSEPLVIARTPPTGDIVELVQMPGQGLNQWIFEETCQFETENGLNCCLVERHVRGLFINLSRISQGKHGNNFDFSDIIIQSCAAFTSVS